MQNLRKSGTAAGRMAWLLLSVWVLNGLWDALVTVALINNPGPYSMRRAWRKDRITAVYNLAMAILCVQTYLSESGAVYSVTLQMIAVERAGYTALLGHDLIRRAPDVNSFEKFLLLVNGVLLAHVAFALHKTSDCRAVLSQLNVEEIRALAASCCRLDVL